MGDWGLIITNTCMNKYCLIGCMDVNVSIACLASWVVQYSDMGNIRRGRNALLVEVYFLSNTVNVSAFLGDTQRKKRKFQV